MTLSVSNANKTKAGDFDVTLLKTFDHINSIIKMMKQIRNVADKREANTALKMINELLREVIKILEKESDVSIMTSSVIDTNGAKAKDFNDTISDASDHMDSIMKIMEKIHNVTDKCEANAALKMVNEHFCYSIHILEKEINAGH